MAMWSSFEYSVSLPRQNDMLLLHRFGNMEHPFKECVQRIDDGDDNDWCCTATFVPKDLQMSWSEVKDETTFRYANTEIWTRVIVDLLSNTLLLDLGGDPVQCIEFTRRSLYDR